MNKIFYLFRKHLVVFGSFLVSLSYYQRFNKNGFERIIRRRKVFTGFLQYVYAIVIVMFFIIPPVDFLLIFEEKIYITLLGGLPIITIGFLIIFLLRIQYLQGISQRWLIIPDLCNIYAILGYYFSKSIYFTLLQRIQLHLIEFIVIIYYLLAIFAIYYDALTGNKYYKQIIDEMQEKTKIDQVQSV